MLADKLEAVEAKMESNMEIAWAHNFESGNISLGRLESENKTNGARVSRRAKSVPPKSAEMSALRLPSRFCPP